MTFLQGLYKLLIGPLALLFEVLFSLSYRVLHSPGLCIIAISLAMNFLVLPLYRRADKIQEEERAQREKMSRWTEHIKKTFKGDERFMMLQTYQRQNGYKPTDALKGSVSLLLEIPFFIAAYQFLSHLQVLQGVPFGPIRDLGLPDALLSIGGTSINLLPILMTVINLASAAIYMKGMPKANKIQMVALAVIFLVFLYQSPAGLVFYWTLNNVFSLCKNIFYKLKDPGRALAILAALAGAAGIAGVLVLRTHFTPKQTAVLLAGCVALLVPLVLRLLPERAGTRRDLLSGIGTEQQTKRLFIGSAAALTLLAGLWIPSEVIKASPAEFVDIMAYRSPLWYLLGALLLSAGTFLVWCGVFYYLASEKGKKWIAGGMLALVACGLVDYLFFGLHYGQLGTTLQYDVLPVFSRREMGINLLVLLGILAVLFFLLQKKAGWLRGAVSVVALGIAALSVVNIVSIETALGPTRDTAANWENETAVIPLSRTGKNVIVLMMDRGIGSFVPYIMQEKPEIREQWAGFTYYPNTISFGDSTNSGVPGLYGGYEYTPEEMNRRSELPLAEKHDEALKVMPRLFLEHGYEVTVCDPTYAGYGMIPDLRIYDEYPEIHTYLTMNGQFRLDAFTENGGEERMAPKRMRDFFCYSLFKMAPVVLQPTLYSADYNAMATISDHADNPGVRTDMQFTEDGIYAEGLKASFMNAYAVLCHLPQITEIREDEQGCFLMMSNDTTHETMALQEPEYEPDWIVDNRAYDATHPTRVDADGNVLALDDSGKRTHYEINVAAFKRLGNWFDYLREQGVYDNTRIIVVSDHGRGMKTDPEMVYSYTQEGTGETMELDLLQFHNLLLVKDFDSVEYTTDERFTTNADTPSMAMQGLIEDPVNPFTGNPITMDMKEEPELHIMIGNIWNPTENNGNTFIKTGWLALRNQNSLDPANWEYIGEK